MRASDGLPRSLPFLLLESWTSPSWPSCSNGMRSMLSVLYRVLWCFFSMRQYRRTFLAKTCPFNLSSPCSSHYRILGDAPHLHNSGNGFLKSTVSLFYWCELQTWELRWAPNLLVLYCTGRWAQFFCSRSLIVSIIADARNNTEWRAWSLA